MLEHARQFLLLVPNLYASHVRETQAMTHEDYGGWDQMMLLLAPDTVMPETPYNQEFSRIRGQNSMGKHITNQYRQAV